MFYATTDQFGLTLDQCRRLFPDISFPLSGVINNEKVYSYIPTVTPEYDTATHAVREAAPVGGVQQWEVYPLPSEEVEANHAAAVQALQQSIVDATQQRLDEFARTRNYDGILSACTYATSNIPKFAAEWQVAVNLRDATWATLYQILEEIQAGQREAPTGFSDIEPLLPPLEWPV
jgi:hypothetical protein